MEMTAAPPTSRLVVSYTWWILVAFKVILRRIGVAGRIILGYEG